MMDAKPNDDYDTFSPLPNWAGSWTYGYSGPTYDPITWNCAIDPYIIGPKDRNHLPPVNIGAKARVHGMCKEGEYH